MAMVMEQLRQNGGGQFVGEENQQSWRRNGVTLEEKYFRRVPAFEGDFAQIPWMVIRCKCLHWTDRQGFGWGAGETGEDT